MIIGAIGVLLAFPLRLIQLGFLPPDDALRYAARAVSGKTWAEIMLIRPEITIDHNPGWNLLLGFVHSASGWDAKQLADFSVVLFFMIFAATPLLLLRKPETWLASLAVLTLVFPYYAERVVVGRPFLLTSAVALVLLWLWKSEEHRNAERRNFVVSIILIALCVWIHGSWYLLGMVSIAFFLCRRWRAAVAVALCWLAGSVLGAILTGHPWKYLYESALIPVLALGQKVPLNALAGEFQAYSGGLRAIVIVGLILGARYARGLPLNQASRDPVLWMAILGWALGYKVFRFWLDWGLPALAFWVAVQLEELYISRKRIRSTVLVRTGMAAAAAVLLLMIVSDDNEQRWSRHSQFEAMDARRPDHAEWLPDRGGVLYAVNMSVFYETFFTNPRGDWRYALGFEPSFMMPDDYAVFRELWETLNAIKSVQPWVSKMIPADRLVLLGPENVPPTIPQLEWKYVVKDTWVGRVPRRISTDQNQGRE